MLLSAETHEKIRAEIAHYPNARGALLYALHAARDDAGALGREIFAEVGVHFGMRAGEVAEVASFYSLYNQPKVEAANPGLRGTAVLPERCARTGARGGKKARHQVRYRDCRWTLRDRRSNAG
jgi:Thioredoxin-like [2Fe-2S] ferredoxin